MSQSLVKNYLHITFSTKHRQPLITEQIEPALFNYMGGICKELQSPAVQIGGYHDHVHVLCMLSKKIALMKFMETLKSHSSKWIKTLDPSLQTFYWQDGYGAFSVNTADINKVRSYILNQRVHHRATGFQDEYRALLQKHAVDFDERYVWD